jgi:hypothetical protein
VSVSVLDPTGNGRRRWALALTLNLNSRFVVTCRRGDSGLLGLGCLSGMWRTATAAAPLSFGFREGPVDEGARA